MTKPGFFSHDHPAYPAHITTNVILTTFLAIVSSVTTMIGNAAIQGELALSNTQSIWITTLYLLGVNTTVPTANWFANQFGFNRVYTYGVIIFTLANLAAAFATNFFMIASARFIEGIGAGFIFPVGLALIAESMSEKKIGLAINLYIGIAFGAGLGLGTISAGYLTQFHSWRDLFFLTVPCGTLTSISCWLSRNKVPVLNKSKFEKMSYFTFVLFFASLLIALTLGPMRATPEGWGTPYILFLFALALISLIAFLFFEFRKKNPLFPIALFKDPMFNISLVLMFFFGMAIFSGVSVSVQYMLDGILYERFVAGKIASIYGFTIGVFSMVANALTKVLSTSLITFTGLFLLIFSYFYNNELSWLTGYRQVIIILIIRGIGIGLSLGPVTLMALRDVAAPLKKSAATTLTFFRQIGGTYGSTLLAIIGIRRSIFHTARFGEQINPQLPAYQQTFQNLIDQSYSPAQAKASIIQNIRTQAQIQGLNDALIIFGLVTCVVTLVLAVLLSYRAWQCHIKKKRSGDT